MKIEEYLEKTGFAFMQVNKLLLNHVTLIIRFISDVTDSSDIYLDFVLIFYILG